ncbi:MAG: recombinase family protein, partial [Ruminococcus flavefaciens]|nr:recombinase family protein [Ruminococcus flavefaciens]
EMKALRKFIETEKAKQAATQRSSAELDMILERLEKEGFAITEYDDIVVRQLIEKITVMDKNKIKITFKGGFEVGKELNGY